ncbi:hypothetical protein POM88_045298 [Heracleum sosnowskyi]|uniref:Uncharacterized protein n=1 Tax=Heracleum sosnowskyi TaxID=360622 RepID=A0AAD8H716_9APIA|nr:hypothetical protein POM88_045298 [Heracleum sosnowskyi]
MTHYDNTGGESADMSGDGESLLQQNEAILRKGPWTKEEDEILVNFVKEKGIVKWTSIGKQTGLARSGKSCRLRWLNHLRPNLKRRLIYQGRREFDCEIALAINGVELLLRRRKEFLNISREKEVHTQVTQKVDVLKETSKPTILHDGSSRNDNTVSEKLEGVLAEESSKREVNYTTLTEGSKNYDLSVEDTREEDIVDRGSAEGLSSKQYDFTKCLKMEDSLLIEGFNVGREFIDELKEDLLNEGSSRGLLTESLSKDELVVGESSCKGDQLIKIMGQQHVTDASRSKDIHTLKVNFDKEFFLTSREQYPVGDEADLFSSQRPTSYLLESGGQDINSNFIKHSAESCSVGGCWLSLSVLPFNFVCGALDSTLHQPRNSKQPDSSLLRTRVYKPSLQRGITFQPLTMHHSVLIPVLPEF